MKIVTITIQIAANDGDPTETAEFFQGMADSIENTHLKYRDDYSIAVEYQQRVSHPCGQCGRRIAFPVDPSDPRCDDCLKECHPV